VGALDAASPGSPQLGRDQPWPQRFPVHPDPIVLANSSAASVGSVVVPQLGLPFLPEQLYHSLPPPASSGSKLARAAWVAGRCLPPSPAASAMSAPSAANPQLHPGLLLGDVPFSDLVPHFNRSRSFADIHSPSCASAMSPSKRNFLSCSKRNFSGCGYTGGTHWWA
jgi:hypothetical protein